MKHRARLRRLLRNLNSIGFHAALAEIEAGRGDQLDPNDPATEQARVFVRELQRLENSVLCPFELNAPF